MLTVTYSRLRVKPTTPVTRPHNLYRIYGLDFLKHPWRQTHDYSRIRALARDASLRWPTNATEVVVESMTVGFLPIAKFVAGSEYRWRGG